MSTTAVFVEILIIGVQASVWFSILILTLTGTDWIIAAKPDMKTWMNPFLLFFVAFSYTLGIIVDRMADFLYNVCDIKKYLLRSDFIENSYRKIHADPKMAILSKEGKAIAFLDYVRSRIRILRATVINMAAALPLALVFILLRTDSIPGLSKWTLLFVCLVCGAFVFCLAFIALGMLQITYDRRLEQARNVLENEKNRA